MVGRLYELSLLSPEVVQQRAVSEVLRDDVDGTLFAAHAVKLNQVGVAQLAGGEMEGNHQVFIHILHW